MATKRIQHEKQNDLCEKNPGLSKYPQYYVGCCWERLLKALENDETELHIDEDIEKLSTHDLMTLGVKMIEEKFPNVDVVYETNTKGYNIMPVISNGKFASITMPGYRSIHPLNEVHSNKGCCDKYDKDYEIKYTKFNISIPNVFPTVEDYNNHQRR
jgi:hypothetical protein